MDKGKSESPAVERFIMDFFAGEVPGEVFMRQVMIAEWIVPAKLSEEGPAFLCEEHEGKRVLTMFSSDEMEEQYRIQVPTPSEFRIRTSGYQAILWLDPKVEQVWFNPGSELAFTYTGDYLWLLDEWARGLEVEAMLEDAEAGEGLLIGLREFDAFRVLVSRDDKSEYVIMAPDDQGRKIAAIYTAEDAAMWGYLEAEERQPEADLHIIKMGGSELFQRLIHLEIDGFVFNHAGPGRPRAFQKALINDILGA